MAYLEKLKHLKPAISGSSASTRARNRSNIKETFSSNRATMQRNHEKIGAFNQKRNIGG